MATLNLAKAFLGVGWAYPPCAAKDGTTALAAYEEDVKEAVRTLARGWMHLFSVR
jgi:hypothetical protein